MSGTKTAAELFAEVDERRHALETTRTRKRALVKELQTEIRAIDSELDSLPVAKRRKKPKPTAGLPDPQDMQPTLTLPYYSAAITGTGINTVIGEAEARRDDI